MSLKHRSQVPRLAPDLFCCARHLDQTWTKICVPSSIIIFPAPTSCTHLRPADSTHPRPLVMHRPPCRISYLPFNEKRNPALLRYGSYRIRGRWTVLGNVIDERHLIRSRTRSSRMISRRGMPIAVVTDMDKSKLVITPGWRSMQRRPLVKATCPPIKVKCTPWPPPPPLRHDHEGSVARHWKATLID